MEIMPYIWFAVTILMAILEGTTYQLVSIWFGLGALVTTVVSIFVPELFWLQLIVFIAVSVISLIITRPIVKKLKSNKVSPTNSDKYIGMTAIVKSDIGNSDTVGQVVVNGDVWSAKSEDNTKIIAGERVLIKDIQGVKLIVTPVKE